MFGARNAPALISRESQARHYFTALLDITDYHEDQWLRLWFLGGASKPVTGQGKDDRHRRIESYWQFLREAWKGIVPLLQDSAHIVIRMGGTRLGEEELRRGLLDSLNSTGRKFRLANHGKPTSKTGSAAFSEAAPEKDSVEHDFRFKLS